MRGIKSSIYFYNYVPTNFIINLYIMSCLFVKPGHPVSCKCGPPTKLNGIFDPCNFHPDNDNRNLQTRWSNCSTHQLPENGTFYMDSNGSHWEVFCGHELNEFYNNSECDIDKLYECKYDSEGQVMEFHYSDVRSQCFKTERCIPGTKWTTRRCETSLKKCMCPKLPLDESGRVFGLSKKSFCGYELENLAINKRGLCENHGLYFCNYGKQQDGSPAQRKTETDCAFRGENCTLENDPSKNDTRICQHPEGEKNQNGDCTCPESWLQKIPRNESLGQIGMGYFYVSYCGFELNEYFKNENCKSNHIISCFQYERSNWTTIEGSVSAECVNQCQIDTFSQNNRGRKCSI